MLLFACVNKYKELFPKTNVSQVKIDLKKVGQSAENRSAKLISRCWNLALSENLKGGLYIKL